MEKLGLNEIRKRFLDFFESKGHYVGGSFPLVPKDDNSLLLINAGMAPLKKYFTGAKTPPKNRMVTCQKCIRTGDIDNVGKTSRHATFFEMLGNFSFGDYFKEKSLEWGWEFLTEVLEIPEDKLWASVYLDDDEAYDIWVKKIGIPEDRIVRLGKDENFWEIGTGPCGPCSEIHFDRGPEYYCETEDCKPGDEGDRIIEIWNHVFTQFNKTEDGVYENLANPNIDTGMGLERVACVMQDVDSIFDVDTIKSIREAVCDITGATYGDDEKDDISIRIITDHIRAVSFMIGDGIMPGNSGRDYVLRRLLRRAARHGKLLGMNKTFLSSLVDEVVKVSGEAYPDLVEKQDYIKKIVTIEEEKFQETIDQGMELLDKYIDEIIKNDKKELDGAVAFKLYDTYGFPFDLTKEILEEKDLSVDENTFKEEMKKQKQRARAAYEAGEKVSWDDDKDNILEDVESTVFDGYQSYTTESQVMALLKDKRVDLLNQGDEGIVILDHTPFYAESGGQLADTGVLTGNDFIFDVADVKKKGDVFLHVGHVVEGQIKVGDTLKAEIDTHIRKMTAQNHTATHLLHKALKIVLGDHVKQAGSLVSSEVLRFDFSHFEGLSDDEVENVERIINSQIMKALEVEVINTDIENAKALGATALFDEKYGDTVRVIKIDDFSMELCGGTHLNNTAEVGLFKIVSESAIASGVRRITAVTGLGVLNKLKEAESLLDAVSETVKSNPSDLLQKVHAMKDEIKSLDEENAQLKRQLAKSSLDDVIADSKEEINGIQTIIAALDQVDSDTLRELSDNLANEHGDIFILLASNMADKVMFLAKTSESLVKKGVHCGNIVREVAKITGGGGGGRPNMAQAGGKDTTKTEEAMKKAKEIIASL